MPGSARPIPRFGMYDTAGNDIRDRIWEQRLGNADADDRVTLRPCAAPDPGAVRFQSERDLVNLVVSGDRNASLWFVKKFERLVYEVVRETPIPIQERRDVCQQVYLSLWEQECRRLRMWEARGRGRLASYLSVIIRRTAYNWMRKHMRTGSKSPIAIPNIPRVRSMRMLEPEPAIAATVHTAVEQNTENVVIGREQKRAIRYEVSNMLRRDSELLRRRYFRGQSYAEIADAMGMTINHVGVALTRAQKRMYDKLMLRHPGLFD